MYKEFKKEAEPKYSIQEIFLKYFSKGEKEREISQKYHENVFSALVIWKVNIKALLRFLLTPDRRTNIKKKTNRKCQKGWKDNTHSLLVGLLNYTTLQNSVDNYQKADSKSSIWSNCTAACHILKGVDFLFNNIF